MVIKFSAGLKENCGVVGGFSVLGGGFSVPTTSHHLLSSGVSAEKKLEL